MEKYYTPKLEEFHVGFEYEFKSNTFDGTVKTKEQFDEAEWSTDTFEGHDFPYLYRALNGRNVENGLCGIRVKYLDRDCIESLGWSHDYNAEPIPNREELPVYEGYLFDKQNETGELWILYHFSDNIVWIEYIKDCGLQGYVFKGTIKNKSELKKLLKQLGI